MKSMEALFKQHPQWKDVVHVCQQLHQRGFEAVLAGGCVRDALLGKLAKDIDVATSATPEQVEAIFPRVIMVGKSFGVCRVVVSEDSLPLEVATFREESDYHDGRRPERVVYSDMEKDSARRDFTVNAMFYDIVAQKVIDHVGGQKDLQSRILRTVGVAEERFAEDSLRLLRAARFAAQLNFVVESATLLAIQNLAPQLARVSFERRQDEINKAFSIEQPFLFFRYLEEMKLQSVLFPSMVWKSEELANFFHEACPADWGWAALVCLEISSVPSKTVQAMEAFKLSKNRMRFIIVCCEVEVFLRGGTQDLPIFVRLMQEPQIADVILFFERYLLALGEVSLLDGWKLLKVKYAPHGLPLPLVAGQDLLSQGVKAGPELGVKLHAAYLLQLQNPVWSREQILAGVVKSNAAGSVH